MKPLFAALILAGGLAPALQGQTEPPAPTPAATTLGVEAVAVTGCLRETEDEPSLFILVRAGEPAGQIKVTGPAIYRLVGGTVDLKNHVDQKVSVTGTLAKSPPLTQPEAKPIAKAPASLTSADAQDTPVLNVTSLEPVSDTCSPPVN